jgi:hypothetical protein
MRKYFQGTIVVGLACGFALTSNAAAAAAFSFTAEYRDAGGSCGLCPAGNAVPQGDVSNLSLPSFSEGDVVHGAFSYDPLQPPTNQISPVFANYTGQSISLSIPSATFTLSDPQILVQYGVLSDGPNFLVRKEISIAAPPGHDFRMSVWVNMETVFWPPTADLPTSLDLANFYVAAAGLGFRDIVDGKEIGSIAYTFRITELDQSPFAATSPPTETPLPGALPLFATGLVMAGFAARRKVRHAA